MIDYVALGHVHHAFALPDGPGEEPLLFSPGALENWSTREVGERKGFYDVVVDTSQAWAPRQQARLMEGVAYSRKYLKLALEVDPYLRPQDLVDAVVQLADGHLEARPDRPIVELRLSGLLKFERGLLDPGSYESILRDKLDCLIARVVLDTESRPAGEATVADLQKTRSEIEQGVLRAMFERFDEYAPHAAELAAIATRLKSQVVQSDSPESLLEYLTDELQRAGVIECK